MRGWKVEDGPPRSRRPPESPPASGGVLRAALAVSLGVALSGWAAGCGPGAGEAESDRSGSGGEEAPADARPEGDGSAGDAVADSLLAAWMAAAGGRAAWDSVRSARYTVTTVWLDSTGSVRRMRPRRVELRKTADGAQARIERPEAEGLYVQVWAGDTAWAALNGTPLPPDDPAAAEAEYVGRDVFYWIGLPYKLMDPGVQRRARALPEGGYEMTVTFGARVGAHPGDRYFYYFLDDDPYPEEVHYIEQGREERDRNRAAWSGFREAGPITYVVTRKYRDSAGRPTKELRIDDVQVNPELPDSLFRPPAPGASTARP